MSNFAAYRKFYVALAGVVALGLQQFVGVGDGTSLLGMPVDGAVDMAIGLATAFGVKEVPNR